MRAVREVEREVVEVEEKVVREAEALHRDTRAWIIVKEALTKMLVRLGTREYWRRVTKRVLTRAAGCC